MKKTIIVEAAEFKRLVMDNIKARQIMEAALTHSIANMGSKDNEFYSCYTYGHGRMPQWVKSAKTLLDIKDRMKIEYVPNRDR